MLVHRDTIYRGAKDRSNLEELESRCCIIIAKPISIPILCIRRKHDKIHDVHTRVEILSLQDYIGLFNFRYLCLMFGIFVTRAC